jgi:hypothetical protein
MALDRPTTAAVPYEDYPEPLEVVMEDDKAIPTL